MQRAAQAFAVADRPGGCDVLALEVVGQSAGQRCSCRVEGMHKLDHAAGQLLLQVGQPAVMQAEEPAVRHRDADERRGWAGLLWPGLPARQ